MPESVDEKSGNEGDSTGASKGRHDEYQYLDLVQKIIEQGNVKVCSRKIQKT